MNFIVVLLPAFAFGAILVTFMPNWYGLLLGGFCGFVWGLVTSALGIRLLDNDF